LSERNAEASAIAIVQARLGSIRLPGKVLHPFLGHPLLGHLLERLSRAKTLSRVVLAIPESSVNDPLEEAAFEYGVEVSRGSEVDVLDRFLAAANRFESDVYVRITADCPLLDPKVVDSVVQRLRSDDLEYCSTGLTFPDGYDVEAFTSQSLRQAAENARDSYDREHVTPWIKRNFKGRSAQIEFGKNLGSLRLTIDEPEDLEVVSAVFTYFGHNLFDVEDVAQLATIRPELFSANRHLVRNAGATMGSGEKLWSRANRVIAGGTMLLSKHPSRFLPEGWPTYFSRTSGCRVWDLDGVPYWDVGLMGVGTNILGFSHPEVDAAVSSVVEKGNLSSLNAPEEVYLAEELCRLHPWASMARFTRSGGEAMAVAVRIARGASGREKIALCGYHGWHDWYLAANISESDALGEHLLPGLDTVGVPGGLKGTSRPFRYNDIEALRRVLEEGEVGAIVMEVERNESPKKGFLQEVRTLATQHSAVLIFDECTSGFRETLGGLHLKYGVNPDIAVFGKTLGNGYAVNAVIGRSEVMEAIESTFVSSTFWTDRIGSAAALVSLRVMEEENAPSRVHRLGLEVQSNWRELARRYDLDPIVTGLPAIGSYQFGGFKSAEVKTYIVRRMLEKGFLATNSFYASIAHTAEVMEPYYEGLDEVFAEIALLGPEGLTNLLGGHVAVEGFGRLN